MFDVKVIYGQFILKTSLIEYEKERKKTARKKERQKLKQNWTLLYSRVYDYQQQKTMVARSESNFIHEFTILFEWEKTNNQLWFFSFRSRGCSSNTSRNFGDFMIPSPLLCNAYIERFFLGFYTIINILFSEYFE